MEVTGKPGVLQFLQLTESIHLSNNNNILELVEIRAVFHIYLHVTHHMNGFLEKKHFLDVGFFLCK